MTLANEVWRRALESNGEMRTSRCTPFSVLSQPKALRPLTWMVADLMPASSPVGLFDPFDLVAVLLGPARIHAQQHVGPVLALGAAGAGMDFEIAVVGIGLARQQRLELAPRHLGLELLERRLGVGDRLLILLGLAELDHGELVVELLLDAADGGELVLERGALLHHALRALLVVPEIGVFGLLVQLRRAARAPCRSQRCLLSSPTDCLISSTIVLDFRAHGPLTDGARFQCRLEPCRM